MYCLPSNKFPLALGVLPPGFCFCLIFRMEIKWVDCIISPFNFGVFHVTLKKVMS